MAKKKPKHKKKKGMTNRFFFKTVIQVEVLSENPFEFTSLKDLACLFTEGICAGDVQVGETEELTALEAVEALKKLSYDPGFFHLTTDGEDADEKCPENATGRG